MRPTDPDLAIEATFHGPSSMSGAVTPGRRQVQHLDAIRPQATPAALPDMRVLECLARV